MRPFIGMFVVTFLLVTPFPATAVVIDPALRETLQGVREGEEVRIIVTLADRVDLDRFRGKANGSRGDLIRALRETADRTQQPLRALLQQWGVTDAVPLWAINGLAFSARRELVETLAGMPGVARLRLDVALQRPKTKVVPAATPEWNLEAVHAPDLWALGHTGAGVVVAAMDTGVDGMHPDLSTSWRGGTNSWFDPNNEHATPYDHDGHGTQTMGLVVGGSAGGTAIGVAPDARWIAVKIFNDRGDAYLSGIHLGFQWLLDPDRDPDTDDAPHVVNNSWGFAETVDRCFTEFQSDLDVLKAAGMAVVFAAGNTGPHLFTSISPANNPGSFAVGAVDQAQNVGYFSSRGPSACDGSIFPEVTAPGVGVRTADLTLGGIIADSYVDVEGTSFAAPHVAGAIALLRSAVPEAPATAIEEALRASATDLGASGPDPDHGHGLIDVAAALQLLQAAACTDADGDGFSPEAGCSPVPDCNDGDAGIHPGGFETKHDGIDQDCNGYDLTIEIVHVAYDPKRDVLAVEATSALGAAAGLQVSGYKGMKWDRKAGRWGMTTRPAGGNPGTVTVAGPEGEATAPVQ